MAKIISVLLCFIFIISNVNAGSLSESFPSEVSGIFVIDSSFVKHLFDVNSETTALTDCYNGITTVVKEKFGIDFDKDVEQLGYLLFLDNNKIKTIGFISGNFKINDIIPSLPRTLASETELIENVELNNRTITTVKMDDYRIVFYDEKFIWFCDDYEFKYYKEKTLSLGKAPDYISDFSDKSKTFFSIKKELWPKLFNYNPQSILCDLDSVDVISAYLDNSDIVFSFHLDSIQSAETLKMQFDYFFKTYKDSKNQGKINIEEINKDTLKQINSLYLSSRIIDIIDSFKIEVNNNNLVIQFPYNRTNYYNAISDFIMNVAIPAYEKAKEENQKLDCYYSQHFFTKVVEKYNNENEPMLYYLDETMLRTQGYIPYGYSAHERRGCKFKAVGHLDNGGYIVCEKHGPAVPLIKPFASKERLAQEEDMLKCIINKKHIRDAVHKYNYERTSRYRVKPTKSDSKSLPSMTTKLNLELLKEEGYLESNLLDISGCEYYISGDLNDKGYIGCKKHGLLTNGQLYDLKYDLAFRRPDSVDNKDGYRSLKEVKTKHTYDEDEINFQRNYRTLKNELEINLIADLQKDKFLEPCQRNIKIISNAVEMYNMDQSVMMTTSIDFSVLSEKGYLRTPLEKVAPDCEYFVVGDLSGNGYISCRKHGSSFDVIKNK